MTTAGEIENDQIARIFHRRDQMAWTHPIGRRGGYRSSRGTWVGIPCDCPSTGTVEPPVRLQDLHESQDGPGVPGRRFVLVENGGGSGA